MLRRCPEHWQASCQWHLATGGWCTWGVAPGWIVSESFGLRGHGEGRPMGSAAHLRTQRWRAGLCVFGRKLVDDRRYGPDRPMNRYPADHLGLRLIQVAADYRYQQNASYRAKMPQGMSEMREGQEGRGGGRSAIGRRSFRWRGTCSCSRGFWWY